MIVRIFGKEKRHFISARLFAWMVLVRFAIMLLGSIFFYGGTKLRGMYGWFIFLSLNRRYLAMNL